MTANWHNLEYHTPITEFVTKDQDFIIKGVAISETTTHNNHKYIAEELQKAAPSLIGRPLLVDHDNRVESIKGRITDSLFDPALRHIKFEAKVMDEKIREMIKDGRINNVSIGAYAEDLVKEDSGAIIAKGIKIAELSLVAVPADDNANFGMAMSNNYSLKESLIEKSHCPECDKEFADEEEMKKHKKDKHSESSFTKSEKSTERRYGEMTEELEINKLKEELSILRNEKKQNLISEYKRECEAKRIQARDISNANEETIKLLTEQAKEIKIVEKEMKSVIGEIPEELNNFVMETDNGKSSFWIMPSRNGTFTYKKW